MGVILFPSPKVNVIARLEFELAYFKAAVHYRDSPLAGELASKEKSKNEEKLFVG